MATLFERSGGFARVSKIVSAFYDRVLDSPVLSPYFEGSDMRRIIDHQTKFIAQAMGGPASYSNQELERVHARHKIDDAAFQEMLLLLHETLEDFGMDEADIEIVCSDVRSRKPYVVNVD